MRRFVLFLLGTVLSFSQVLKAQQISESEAKDKAVSFFNNRPSNDSGALRAPKRGGSNSNSSETQISLAYTAGENGTNYFYVYNNGENEGFVIVGGDEKVESILAYSYSGHIDMDNASENFKWWISTTEEGISRSLRMNQSYLSMSGDSSHVDPLLTTHWGQGYPYNAMTPTFSEDDSLMNCPTGCVATAMAQVIYYHKYPNVGFGNKTYYCNILGATQELSFDFANTQFDWNNMRTSYNADNSIEEKKAVATLMYACGVSVSMEYGAEESGAQQSAIIPALRNYFGYNSKTASFSFETIKSELGQGYPLIYGGGSHVLVIDGYDEQGLLHLNMGWDGNSNGYYAMNDMGGFSVGGTLITVHKPSTEATDYYNVEIGDIKYDLFGNNKTASVVGLSDNYISTITIPSEVTFQGEQYSVARLNDMCFYACSELTDVILSEGLETIGYGAFFVCNQLRNINIPNTVKCIDREAFAGCTTLERISLPESVERIVYPFVDCFSLSTIELDSNNPFFYYYEGAIYDRFDNSLITAVPGYGMPLHIKEGTEIIREAACAGTNIPEFVFPNTIKEMRISSFNGNARLKRVIIPDSCEIVYNAFHDNDSLEYVYIPKSVTYLDFMGGEFAYCPRLKEFEISEDNPSYRVIDNNIFSKDTVHLFKAGTNTRDSVFLPSSTKFIESHAFQNCQMKYIDLSNIKAFGDGLFSYCENLESIVIPEGIQRIPSQTFDQCHSLKEITLPSTLEGIWSDAFWGCTNLFFINCNFTNPFSISDAFYRSYFKVNGILSVPVGTKALFENTEGWKDFSIFEKDELVQEEPKIDSILISPSRSWMLTENDSIKLTINVFPEDLSTENVVFGMYCYEYEPPVSIDKRCIVKPILEESRYHVFSYSNVTIFAIAKDGSKAIASTSFKLIRPLDTFKIRVFIDNEVVYEGLAYYGQSIDEIKQIVFSVDTIKEEMTFSGWSFPDVEDTGSGDFWGTKYYDVHGSFTINKYLLTYKVDGETISSDSIAYGTALIAKQEPTKEGYTFSGWSEIPSTMPANDVTVTGSFTINSYVITYMVDGEVFYQDTIEYNGSISLPTAPKKEGYMFIDWLDLPETMPAHDVTVTANFDVADGVIGIKPNDSYRVYDINGKFLGEMTDDDLKFLKPGVYIVNNKKLRVK